MTTTYARAVPDDRLITRAEAARILGVSLETVARYARQELLTRHRNPITRAVRYDRTEVETLRRQREDAGEK